MTDIVERLRKSQLHIPGNIVAEAADEIERMLKVLRRLACTEELCGCHYHENENCPYGFCRAVLEGKDL